MGTLNAGVWPTVAVCAFLSVYFATTWSEPHREALLGVIGVAFLSAVLIQRILPMQRIIGSRWCEPFFVGWSSLLTTMIVVASSLDGGTNSPMVALFFLPLVYAALSYPLASMLIVGTVNVGAFLGLAALTPDRSTAQVLLLASCLATAAWICAWQSRSHDEHRRQLDHASRTDPLTGCLNRRGFRERFEAELSRLRREGGQLALIVVDLDCFKSVNDQHGHAAGDELLRWVAARLHSEVRTQDMVGRLGGDEFAVLLTGTPEPEVAVERLLGALAERTPASAGVAIAPLDGVEQDDLHQVADAALYAHKHGRVRPPAGVRRELSWAATLAAAVDERMAVRHEHSQAVSKYAAAIAWRLGWPEEEIARLRLAAMLHDVGKVRLPEEILQKPGRLNDQEWAQVARHPVVGAEIVARVEGLDGIGLWIRHSHERIDGDGYPDGLRGEEIPLASRILLVADAFDAMTSDRSYRRAMQRSEAIAELDRNAGTQFDPACVRALKAELTEHDCEHLPLLT